MVSSSSMVSNALVTEPKVETDLDSSTTSHAGRNVPVQEAGTSRGASRAPCPRRKNAKLSSRRSRRGSSQTWSEAGAALGSGRHARRTAHGREAWRSIWSSAH